MFTENVFDQIADKLNIDPLKVPILTKVNVRCGKKLLKQLPASGNQHVQRRGRNSLQSAPGVLHNPEMLVRV